MASGRYVCMCVCFSLASWGRGQAVAGMETCRFPILDIHEGARRARTVSSGSQRLECGLMLPWGCEDSGDGFGSATGSEGFRG